MSSLSLSSSASTTKPRRRLSSLFSTTTPPPAPSAELEQALRESFALFQVLLHVVPTLQHERQLRFVWAMIDFKHTSSSSSSADYKEKRRFIIQYFIAPHAEFAVDCPKTATKWPSTSSKMWRAYKHALAELCLLPCILACLPSSSSSALKTASLASDASLSSSSTLSVSSASLLYGEVASLPSSSFSTSTMEINVCAQALDGVIQNKLQRRRLVALLLANNNKEEDVVVQQVQFLPAVDHFLNLRDRQEQREMGLKIVDVFFNPHTAVAGAGGGVSRALAAHTERAITAQGKLDKLAVARAEVLNRLCEHPSVLAALNQL